MERAKFTEYPSLCDDMVLYDASLYSHIRSVLLVSIISDIPHPARNSSPFCTASSLVIDDVFAVASP